MGRIYSAPPADDLVEHPGRKLTAAKIISAYDAADDGDPAEQCDLFDDRIEADSHLRSAIETRIDDVARKSWVLIPGGDSPKDERAAQLLEERLREVPNFIATLEHLSRANAYGYAYAEIVWRRIEALAAPAWFGLPHARRFIFDDLDQPRLLTTNFDYEGIALAPGQWWGLTRGGRRAAMSGLLRTGTWWSHIKSLAARDWAIFCNRFGIPNVRGTYDQETATPAEISALVAAVKSIGSDSWGVHPNGSEIEISETTRTGGADEVHGALVNMCNSELSKLISGATLVAENTGPGSFAATREHSSRAFSIIQGDAARLAESFNWCVSRPFCHFNGLDARPPTLKIHVVQNTDPLARLEAQSRFVNEMGGTIDEDQVRHEQQFRVPKGKPLVGTSSREVEASE